jgi:hypothetical protein
MAYVMESVSRAAVWQKRLIISAEIAVRNSTKETSRVVVGDLICSRLKIKLWDIVAMSAQMQGREIPNE